MNAAAEQRIDVRARLFGHSIEAIQPSDGSRLTVVFAPELNGCVPQHMQIVKALKDFARQSPDAGVVVLSPDDVERSAVTRSLFGEPPPGRLVPIPREAWNEETRVSPRPRIEVWSGKGELLLLRSVATAASEEELLTELLWSRTFAGR
ncbi:MAG TPA: hypothetical protein VGF28_14655 [Thermoanaerobaculia bacterium]